MLTTTTNTAPTKDLALEVDPPNERAFGPAGRRATQKTAWQWIRAAAFRVTFVYVLLYAVLATGLYLWMTPLAKYYSEFAKAQIRATSAIGEALLGQEVPVETPRSGSSDRLVNYVGISLIAATSLVLGLAWTLISRSRFAQRPVAPKEYGLTARDLWGLILRYFVATNMLLFGAVKLIPAQFPEPPLDWLIQPFGEISPMRLLWAFMGSSPAYAAFAGIAEVAAGLFLLNRRTSTLGGLLSLGVMANIVVINYSYDICMKISSAHLFFFALLILAPEIRRLADIFLWNRPVGPKFIKPYFSSWRLRTAGTALKLLFVCAFLLKLASISSNQYEFLASPKLPLHGLYEVASFKVDGEERPPLLTDTTRWHRLVINRWSQGHLQRTDGQASFFRQLKVDEDEGTISASALWLENPVTWNYRELEPDRLEITGHLLEGGLPFTAELRRRDPDEYLIRNRAFHWVNETPFNTFSSVPLLSSMSPPAESGG